MINPKLKGIISQENTWWDSIQVDDSGTVLIFIHRKEYVDPGIFKIYLLEQGNYQQILVSLDMPDFRYLVPKIWKGFENTYYFYIESEKEARNLIAIYCLNIDTKQVKEIYANIHQQRVLVTDHQIIEVSTDGILKILAINQQQSVLQDAVYSEVNNIQLITKQGGEALILEFFDRKVCQLDLKPYKIHKQVQRLTQRKQSLIINDPYTTDGPGRIHQEWTFNNQINYYYSNPNTTPQNLNNWNLQSMVLKFGKLIKINSKYKILRRFARTVNDRGMYFTSFILQTTDNGEYDEHTLTNIITAQEQQILEKDEIRVQNKIIIEQRVEELRIYELQLFE